MSTDAVTAAKRYYAAAKRDWAAELSALARNPHGVVLISPALVVLMKPVDSTQPQDWEELGQSPAVPDAWYVHLLAGDVALARQLAWLLPAYPWVCFQRGLRSTRLHRHPWARLLAQLY